jgi:CAAX prenyl protease-like protein
MLETTTTSAMRGAGSALPRIAPFAAFVLLMALAGAAPAIVSVVPALETIPAGWGYAVRTAAAAILLAVFWPAYREFRPGAPMRGADAGTAILVGVLVLGIWLWLGPLVRMGGEVPTDGAAPWPQDTLLAVAWITVRLVGSAIVVPLVEELFWRSWLMRRIDGADALAQDPRSVSWLAVGLSSAVFALEHRELLAGFLAGFAYAWLYRKTGDLRAAVLAHAVTNGLLGVFVLSTGRYEFW